MVSCSSSNLVIDVEGRSNKREGTRRERDERGRTTKGGEAAVETRRRGRGGGPGRIPGKQNESSSSGAIVAVDDRIIDRNLDGC